NVVIASYLSTNPKSPNAITMRLWRERKLQLIISDKIVEEYAEVLDELNLPANLVASFVSSLRESGTATHINLGKRFTQSRDPKDNPFLSTAGAGRAKFLVTNDHDLLDIPETEKHKFKFQILTPKAFVELYFDRFAFR
ncbi:putative toxin-antitoxin system toxin component, PIN family, partial [candidate division KSB1 bacterium]|nr:putative toxin-antitoxin system toxin component, PIN family [candidate division KSB1 bacterium]